MKIDSDALKSQILSFCNEYIDENDIVIGALRYGAHIPHVYQNACEETSQQPKRINLLLSHMINFFHEAYFKGRKIVILDDTIYQGNEMRRLTSILKELGVPEKNIQTEALVVHENSQFLPNKPVPVIRYLDPQYIAWKEALASLIVEDIRPTDRDHPLYYSEISNIGPGQFIDIIENFGVVHSTGSLDSKVFKFSITFDSSILKNNIVVPGISFGDIYKIRFYWKQESNTTKLTLVPMGFPIIDVNKFISDKGGQVLAKFLGLKENFFDDMYHSHTKNLRSPMTYYFASRSLSLLVLELFLKQINPILSSYKSNLKILMPEAIDKKVNYIFPDEYIDFYDIALDRLTRILQGAEFEILNFSSEKWIKIESMPFESENIAMLPSTYEVLGFFAKDSDPAEWDGKRWIPNKATVDKGYTYQDLLTEFKNHIFISRALDELCESGLLRAKDQTIDTDNNVYTRQFLPGGEYNAIHMSRIADTLRYKSDLIVDPKIIEEESIELWGPY